MSLVEIFKGIFTGPSAHDERHDEHGFEQLDPIPVALPVDFKRPPTLQEQVARLVRSEAVRLEAARLGRESFEEADDFSDPEDDPSTPYESDFDIATVQAANSGFIEERPITRERADEVKSKYCKKGKSSHGEEAPSVDGALAQERGGAPEQND